MLTAQERHPECSAGPEWYGYLGIIDTEAITGAPAVGRPSKSAGCLAAQKKNSCRQSRRTSTWPPIDKVAQEILLSIFAWNPRPVQYKRTWTQPHPLTSSGPLNRCRFPTACTTMTHKRSPRYSMTIHVSAFPTASCTLACYRSSHEGSHHSHRRTVCRADPRETADHPH